MPSARGFSPRLGNVMIDCPDEKALQNFYHRLLGWPECRLYGRPAIRQGEVVLMFISEDDYVPPVWPEQPGRQQKQIHLDFQVADITAMAAKAEALGAVKAESQFGGADFVTMIDPAGHPFCLCRP